MRRVLVPTVYVVLVVAAIALVFVNVLAWTGGLADEPTSGESQPAAEPAPQSPPPAPQTGTDPPAAKTRPAATQALTISATRGDCWVEVRSGSPDGELLYAGTLTAGKTLRFNREKLWLRLGAAANVDVAIDGRPSTIPPGTVELLLPT